jgi:hypothetical protein
MKKELVLVSILVLNKDNKKEFRIQKTPPIKAKSERKTLSSRTLQDRGGVLISKNV